MSLMSRFILFALCIITLLAIPAPLRAATISAYERTIPGKVVSASQVRLTITSNVYSKALGYLDHGERVLIDGRDAKRTWWHIRSRAGVGYVPAAALRPDSDQALVPV